MEIQRKEKEQYHSGKGLTTWLSGVINIELSNEVHVIHLSFQYKKYKASL
jgi:hypothetical protein